MPIDLHHTTRRYPTLPYETIATAILSRHYQLSVVFVGANLARRLNQEYRQKDYVPDVLSFPLTPKSGEIFLCLPRIKQTAPRFAHSYKEHVGFLFIHGLLHLKGYEHGATMEKAETRFANRFLFATPTPYGQS